MPEVSPTVVLSPRQNQTLFLLLRGASEKEVAVALRISPHTVHTYVKAIYRVMGVNSRPELMSLWVQAPPAVTLGGEVQQLCAV